MKYKRNIRHIKGRITFHLPDGSIKKFKDAESALAWFDLNYKDLSYEMEDYKKELKSDNQLYSDNYKVLINNNKGINIYAGANYSPAYNEALANPLYVANHNKAILSDPNYLSNWDAANNISEFLNVATGGLLNRLSPTLNIRLIYDGITGKSINPFDYESSWWGNSGLVDDQFAKEHPYITFGINGLSDGLITMGANRSLKYLTEPIVKTGTESEIITSRISPYVIKRSVIEPSEMEIRNSVPTFLKTKYLGTDSDGLHLYRLPKAIILRNPTRAFRNISNTLVNNHYFPFKHKNMQERGFLNITNNRVLSDFGNGLIGRTLYGRPVIIDMSVETIPEFMINMEKKGGKLIPNYYRKFKKGGKSFNNLFSIYNSTSDPEANTITIPTLKQTILNPMLFAFSLPIELQSIELIAKDPITLKLAIKESTNKELTNLKSIVKQSTDDSLLKIDIEDLLKSEGITSVNGKKIKFGDKNLRPANASYGVKNSNHKKRDPHTGNASARDISIVGGTTEDYAEFRSILLNNPRVVQWMAAKEWGIINEITPSVLKRTRGTGPHFHFGPDKWAKLIWNTWLNNPNIPVTSVIN